MKLKVESKKCTGCRLCQLICALTHFRENNPRKAAIIIDAEFPTPGVFRPRICGQCGKCAEVCPEGAISERNGAYIINAEKCTLCLECVRGCPQEVMVTHEEASSPIKCDLCGECVGVCPTNALVLLA